MILEKTRQFLLIAISSIGLFAQPQPTSYVRNAASFGTTLAPGSFGSVNIPSIGVSPVADALITLTPAGSSAVQLTPFPAPNASSSPGPLELWFVIPPNAHPGPASITTVVNGISYTNSIEIVTTAPGIFTSSYSAFGPALALNHPSTQNALTSAAVPNGVVSLFGTGIGGADTSDVTVELDGRSITPLYAGPQGQPGLDQINFVVPPDIIIGCYVPVAIRVRGIPSNQSTISINGDPLRARIPFISPTWI